MSSIVQHRRGAFRVVGLSLVSDSLVAQYDADVGTLESDLTEAEDGEVMVEWQDQSGNANHLEDGSNTGPLLQTSVLNGHNIVEFNGAEGLEDTFTLAQPITTMIVVRMDAWANNARIFDGTSASTLRLYQNGSSPKVRAHAGGTATFMDPDLALDTWGIITVVWNSTSSVFQLNDGTPLTPDLGTGNPGGIDLGHISGGSFSDIDVAYLLIYDDVLTSGEITQNLDFLNDRFSIY